MFGYDATINASGVTEGLQFKYRLDIGGMRVLIRDKTTKGYQSIRVRFSTEVLMANSAPANWRRLLEFFEAIGFVVTNDCISRVDFQLTCDFFTMADIVSLEKDDYFVSKLRKWAAHGKGLGRKKKTEYYRLGDGGNPVQFYFYDKWVELHSGGNYGTQKYMQMQEKIGDAWRNSGRPVTRFEISVKRDGLKPMGIDSVDDLFGNEWAAINLLTQDWLRILNEPKKDGKEYKQQNHPVWDRVRNALYQHFNGKNFDDKAEWKPPAPVSGDPVALEKQAVGCAAKALALRKGEQETEQDSVDAVSNLFGFYGKDLHEKINTIARHMENKTGIPLGDSICEPSWKAELREYYRRSNQEDREKLRESERELRQSIEEPLATIDNANLERARARAREGFPVAEQEQFYDVQGETARERWYDFMDKTKDIHLR